MQQLGERKKKMRAGKHEEGKEFHQRAGERRKVSALLWRGVLKSILLVQRK